MPRSNGRLAWWHFSHEALKGHVHGARLRVMAMDRSYMVDFPDVHDEDGHDDHEGHAHDAHDEGDEDGMEHDHDHAHEGEGPHHGLVRAFLDADGHVAGYIELKLHDDKGDLELWIAKDEDMKKPFDLTSGSQPTVMFTSMKNRTVQLRVRNNDKNEDEDGVANMRAGHTNYFIFPGTTGADAKWLMGKGFKATVAVAFQSKAGVFKTKAFELTPHAH